MARMVDVVAAELGRMHRPIRVEGHTDDTPVITARYRDNWEWTGDLLAEAQQRLASWSAWASRGRSAGTTGILDGLRAALMHDLDTPTAVTAVDDRTARGSAPAEGDLAAIHALLGIRL